MRVSRLIIVSDHLDQIGSGPKSWRSLVVPTHISPKNPFRKAFYGQKTGVRKKNGFFFHRFSYPLRFSYALSKLKKIQKNFANFFFEPPFFGVKKSSRGPLKKGFWVKYGSEPPVTSLILDRSRPDPNDY